jgi:hypothetical protein
MDYMTSDLQRIGHDLAEALLAIERGQFTQEEFRMVQSFASMGLGGLHNAADPKRGPSPPHPFSPPEVETKKQVVPWPYCESCGQQVYICKQDFFVDEDGNSPWTTTYLGDEGLALRTLGRPAGVKCLLSDNGRHSVSVPQKQG